MCRCRCCLNELSQSTVLSTRSPHSLGEIRIAAVLQTWPHGCSPLESFSFLLFLSCSRLLIFPFFIVSCSARSSFLYASGLDGLVRIPKSFPHRNSIQFDRFDAHSSIFSTNDLLYMPMEQLSSFVPHRILLLINMPR
ncbi:hypothetical protein CRM22_002368 [Opisthorchis felineus]|uniref:Uncharacterized protein n=1 Tax=Opisthorchis felineus TaxID=147828 RepID=A0A4S2MCR0_OPIFE|nr:hypothetical protein CRM22_002368 [Opisthorchis felineus]